MLGSIIGDIAGSLYEFHNIKRKEFTLLQERAEITDDSILTVATADWLLHGGDCGHYYLKYATAYPSPMGGYGSGFLNWVRQGQRTRTVPPPYHSCGNGSAMRVGPAGWLLIQKPKCWLRRKHPPNAPTTTQKV